MKNRSGGPAQRAALVLIHTSHFDLQCSGVQQQESLQSEKRTRSPGRRELDHLVHLNVLPKPLTTITSQLLSTARDTVKDASPLPPR